ncbi:MAG: SDR family NAD(P)-dependent oxidoreductase [Alphaproteobacteria bacterium]
MGAIAVTGASRGIGAAIAAALAGAGRTVACLTRAGTVPATALEPAAAARLLPFRCDVTREVDLRAAFAAVVERTGGLDGLVNNAGIHLDGPSDRFETARWSEVMTTNATAVFLACREAYPHLVAAGGGLVVNIGSFFDKLGVKRNTAYCASKAAVGAITRCLAVEWAGKGIRMVDVAPGYIETDLNRDALRSGPLADYVARRIPGGRPTGADEVARLVAALYTADLPFLTGETIYLDGGQGIAH